MRNFTFLLMLMAALPSNAESPPQEVLEEVVVEGRSLKARSGEAASVAVLDVQDIDTIQASHVSEALSRLPGVWISRGSGHEHLTAIRSAVLTGAGACGEFLFLEDGVPVRPTGFCNVNGLFEVNSEQAAGLEVWRGPASSVLGGNALRGAVNVVTRLPQSSRISLEAGPYGFGQGRLELGGEAGGFNVGLAGHTTTSDGWRDDTGYEQHKANLVAEGRVGEWDVRTVLSGSVLHQETGGYVLGTDAYKNDDLRDTNPNPEAYRDAWSLRAAVAFARDGWRITPYARRSDMRFIQHFLPGQPVESNGQTSLGVLLAKDLSTDRLDLTVGGQLETFSGELEEFQAGPTVGSAFLVATRPSGRHYDYEVAGFSAAFNYDLALTLSDGWRLLNSMRLEHIYYDYDNRHIDGNTRDDGSVCGFGGCLYTRPADRDDDFTEVSGRIGVSWTPAAGWGELYAMLATGFRPPQATELYRLQSGQEVADLDSERLYALEVGVKTQHVEVAAFADRVRNFIFRDANGFNVSNGKTRSEGLELALNSGNETHNVQLSLTWARHRYDFSSSPDRREVITDGNDVDTAPRLLANLRYRHQWTESLSHEFEVAFMDDYYTNAENTARYEGHTVVNWRGRWQATERFLVYARLINLLDREYADRADFAFGNDRYFPAMPRQLYVGVDYRF